jgi:c-di-GMP-binding flagellar brake protein YcgR
MSPWRRAPGPDNLPPSTAKRRNQRYLMSAPLTATPCEAQHESKVRTHTLDISESGIGAVSLQGWRTGVHINLDMTLPQVSAHLEVQAIVRHQTGVRCGLEFVNMSPEQKVALRALCHFLASRPV